jgi:predicted dehydrogenase
MAGHRVGIVGCGSRGYDFAAAVASLDAADLVVCADKDAAAARACAEAYGAEPVTTWHDREIDSLIVATDGFDQTDLADAARAGIQVLVDPPLARGVVDARRAVRAVDEGKGRVGLAFDWRFQPLVRLLRQLIPRPLFAHVFAAVDPGGPQSPNSVRQTVWTTPHLALDLLMHLFERPPAEIVSNGGPILTPSGESASEGVLLRTDALVADLYFDRERHASVTVAGGVADPEEGPVVLDVTDGATRVRIWSNWSTAEILPLGDRRIDPPWLPGIELERGGREWLARVEPDGQALRGLVRAFLDCDWRGVPVPGVADGARVVALTRAVLAGAASGRTQTIHGT